MSLRNRLKGSSKSESRGIANAKVAKVAKDSSQTPSALTLENKNPLLKVAKVAKDDPDGCNLSSNFSNVSQTLATNQNQASLKQNKDLSPTLASLATLAVATDRHRKTQLLKGISKTESDELPLATVAKVHIVTHNLNSA